VIIPHQPLAETVDDAVEVGVGAHVSPRQRGDNRATMERTGSTAPGVRHEDELVRLLRRPGPFVTACVARPGHVPNAISSRLQSLRDAAAALSPDTADALTEVVDDTLPHAAGVVVVAEPSGVVFVQELFEPPRSEFIRKSTLPSLAPVVEQRQRDIPFVLVVADRRGAEIYWSDTAHEGSTTVEQDQAHIRKVHAGGWSHRRFQQRAENSWEHLAAEVAGELVRVVDAVHPRVITLAGDVRVGEMLRKHLPDTIAARLRAVPGGRSADGSESHRDEVARRWIRTAVAEDTVVALELFDQERGQGDRAADGAETTFVALREGRVDLLLFHDDDVDDTQAFFVPDEATLISTEERDLTDLGYEIRAGRLVDVALRAAILGGAGVRVVPRTKLADGLGAILRW
jgi:hypothetical protein